MSGVSWERSGAMTLLTGEPLNVRTSCFSPFVLRGTGGPRNVAACLGTSFPDRRVYNCHDTRPAETTQDEMSGRSTSSVPIV